MLVFNMKLKLFINIYLLLNIKTKRYNYIIKVYF